MLHRMWKIVRRAKASPCTYGREIVLVLLAEIQLSVRSLHCIEYTREELEQCALNIVETLATPNVVNVGQPLRRYLVSGKASIKFLAEKFASATYTYPASFGKGRMIFNY